MAYKPSDFFIGVIDFFGILVPGAVLLYLQRAFFTGLLNGQPGQDTTVRWVSFFFGSYVLGHLLLGMGVPLNRLLLLFPERKDAFYREVKDAIALPKGVRKSRADVFHRAYSWISLKNPTALAEIERQMADYKLFRSLTLVFALDLVLGWGRVSESRALFSVVLLVLAVARFLFLLKWTYRTTFEYHVLLSSPLGSGENQEQRPNPATTADA